MQFPAHIPFAEQLGLELVAMADGRAEVAVPLREALCNSFGVGHGGVAMAVLDVAMAHAARSVNTHTPDFSPGVVTIEMKTSFLRPATGRVVGHATLLHRTATLAFCEARLQAADGSLCAHATGTFKYVRAVAAPTGRDARAIQPLRAPQAPGGAGPTTEDTP